MAPVGSPFGDLEEKTSVVVDQGGGDAEGDGNGAENEDADPLTDNETKDVGAEWDMWPPVENDPCGDASPGMAPPTLEDDSSEALELGEEEEGSVHPAGTGRSLRASIITSSTIISSISWWVGRNWSKNAVASTTGAHADGSQRFGADGREDGADEREVADAADSAREERAGDRGGDAVLNEDIEEDEAGANDANEALAATAAAAHVVAATTVICSEPRGGDPSKAAGGVEARENDATAGAVTISLAGELGRELEAVAVITACKMDADELGDPRGEWRGEPGTGVCGKVNEADDGIHPDEASAVEAPISDNPNMLLDEACFSSCPAV
jgi:hypothetical protein